MRVTPLFAKNLKAYHDGATVICNEGGARAGKSYAIMQVLIGAMLNESRVRISVVSHSLPHIRRGVLRDFMSIMDHAGLFDVKCWHASTFTYYNKRNGSYIEFFGLEEEGKARGPSRDILFINEANLISKEVYDQLKMRTTRTTFMDWNPAEFHSWVYKVADMPNSVKIHSTYIDNIHNLPRAIIEQIESYRELPDKFMWNVFGLGLRGMSTQLIYTGYEIVPELPKGGDRYFGLDFGFVHPNALTELVEYENGIYIRQRIYRRKQLKNELYDEMQGMDIGSSPIYADAAESDSIAALANIGFNVHEAKKDVWAGIMYMKSKRMYVTADSVDGIYELENYRWKKDRNGELLEEPIKELDDFCDSFRYGAYTHSTAFRIDFITL